MWAARSCTRRLRTEVYKRASQIVNEKATYLWLHRMTYALVARNEVGGLDAVDGVGFSRTELKPWIGDLSVTR